MSKNHPKPNKSSISKRDQLREARRRRRDARRTAIKPRWTPSPWPELDILYLVKWHTRALPEPDDHVAAPGSRGVYVFDAVGPGLSWAMLKLLWRNEEAKGGDRCDLCGQTVLLYAYWFGGMFGRGIVHLRCPRCSVIYSEPRRFSYQIDPLMEAARQLGYVDGSGAGKTYHRYSVSSTTWLRSPTPGEDAPTGVELLEERPAEPSARAPQRPPLRGDWDLEAPHAEGLFVTANSGGTQRSVQRAWWDDRELRYRAEPGAFEPTWWWSWPQRED